jgi:hypothetical protein
MVLGRAWGPANGGAEAAAVGAQTRAGKSKSVLKPIDGVAGRVLKRLMANRGPGGRPGASAVGRLTARYSSPARRRPLPLASRAPIRPTSHPAMHHMPPGNSSHAKTAPAPSCRLRAMRPRPGAAGLPATRPRGAPHYLPGVPDAAPLASKAPRTWRFHARCRWRESSALGHHAARAVDIGGSSAVDGRETR